MEFTEEMRENRAERGTVSAAPAPNQAQPNKEVDDVAPAKSSRSPAFQFYPNDFLGSPKVQVMSTTEVGAYWLLICACWNEGSLPTDMRRLAAIARMKQGTFERMWTHVLHECFELKGDRLTQIRLEKERAKQRAYSKQQKDKADKRWQSRGNASAMPDGVARHAVGNALQSSSLSPSPSPPSGSTHTPRANAPIHQTHKNHAACGRVCVPADLHSRFVRSLNRSDADSVLRAWYLAVDDEWSVGQHKSTQTGGDDYAFWRARFGEKWPATTSVKDTRPVWAR